VTGATPGMRAESRLAVRTGQRLTPDPARTVTRFFVPGQEGVGGGESRAADVIARLLALDEDEVERSVQDLIVRFGHRHRGFADTLLGHADRVAHRLRRNVTLSPARRLLLGATFTQEYSVEAAALCNPSIVLHPDQAAVADGAARFVMSARGIGEGHRSSIGFWTGQVEADGSVRFDDRGPFPVVGSFGPAELDRDVVHAQLRDLDDDGESAAFVLELLGDRFSAEELERALDALHREIATRLTADETIARFRKVAEATYSASFAPGTAISERVLSPSVAVEAHGMEDARFVRFVDDDGRVVYYATYTAFDGRQVHQQILETTDFATFAVSPIEGAAAATKGLALFPRRIDGRYVALSRWDRESNSVSTSDNVRLWTDAVVCQLPARAWEVLQLGNCGSPIETDAGWLVLTHGVGAMRTYSIGALLLDIDDPTKVLGSLSEPLLTPSADEQDGYVPNVVYTCGAFTHADTLVMPYGIADGAIGIATVPLGALLDRLSRGG
jgi:predicted GH43/DUF377 family glycosyl hydrolase